jgi:hypothetical protein
LPQTRPAPLKIGAWVDTDKKKEISADSAFSALNIKLNQIIEKWIKKGLKREILEKVKEIPLKYTTPIQQDNE